MIGICAMLMCSGVRLFTMSAYIVQSLEFHLFVITQGRDEVVFYITRDFSVNFGYTV